MTVPVGPWGAINLYNDRGTVHLIADVAGWYGDVSDTAGSQFHPVTPARMLDTRNGTGAPAAKVGPAAALGLQVTGRGGVPATGVPAVVLNLTAVEPSTVSFITAWPAGGAVRSLLT